jgi:hypothetical protein
MFWLSEIRYHASLVCRHAKFIASIFRVEYRTSSSEALVFGDKVSSQITIISLLVMGTYAPIFKVEYRAYSSETLLLENKT